jgi:anti-sigma factor RsiW
VTCREFTRFILDYLGGALPDSTRARFERHLARCPECRAYLSNYEATIALGRQAFDDPGVVTDDVPDDLVRAVLDACRG